MNARTVMYKNCEQSLKTPTGSQNVE